MTYDELLRRVFEDEATRILDRRWTNARQHSQAHGLRSYAQYASTEDLLAFVAKLKEQPDA